MFRTAPLSIMRSFSLYTQRWHMSYRFVDSLLTSWWWTEKLSERCRVLFLKKFEKLVYLVGFIIRIYYHARTPEPQAQNQILSKMIYFIGSWNMRCEIQIIAVYHTVGLFCARYSDYHAFKTRSHTIQHNSTWNAMQLQITNNTPATLDVIYTKHIHLTRTVLVF